MKFNHTAHKALWNWLAANPDKSKHDWPEWQFNNGTFKRIYNLCFACDFIIDIEGGCHDCPLIWPPRDDGQSKCDGFGGLYHDWKETATLKERANLAEKVANVGVREGVECI